jgi:hypothetical protein
MIPFLFEVECVGSEIGEICSEASLLQELGKSIRLVKQIHIETDCTSLWLPIQKKSLPTIFFGIFVCIGRFIFEFSPLSFTTSSKFVRIETLVAVNSTKYILF